MNRYYYDLHVHSCLSPCADNDMTPNNIAGMATLCGLQIVALTDHNTTKNCPAFFTAAKRHGIIPIAGMELTTAEDIHLVCLFERLEDACRFGDAVEQRRILLPNRPDIFGEQLITDGEDEVVGEEDALLSNATTISVDEAPCLVHEYGGVCFPAHVDREANGLIATLGDFPAVHAFDGAELHDPRREEEYRARFTALRSIPLIFGSDAHYLWDIREAECYYDLEDEPYSSDFVRAQLFRAWKGDLS